MRQIDYTFEDKNGQEMTVKVEYTIIPFREGFSNDVEDDIEVFSITHNNQEVDLEEETLTDLIDYIRDNDEDDIDMQYYL
jgi:hypothetical protein